MKDSILTIIKFLLIIFLIPLWCFLSWNTFAWEFNLPIFSYWHWVVTALAIRGIFTPAIITTGDE